MYTVESFYDNKLMGLENRETEIEDWDKVVELSHEWVSNGSYVRITNNETGIDVTLDYDSYFDGFEGEFPVDIKDLEEDEAERE